MEERILRCPSCGRSNRVPSLPSGKKAVCGNCKGELPAGGTVEVLTDATFDQAVSRGRHVVDFWAAWCGPCRILAPIVEDLAKAHPDVSFAKLNVDENRATAARFNVQGIPLLVFIRDGREAGRVVGAVPRQEIESAVARYLG